MFPVELICRKKCTLKLHCHESKLEVDSVRRWKQLNTMPILAGLIMLHSQDVVSIDTAKTVSCDTSVKNDILFSTIPASPKGKCF